jgi:hypothetical protein
MVKYNRGPDFILGGPPKSGSTALAYALSQHPEVGIPPHDLSFWSLYGNAQQFRKQQYTPLTDPEAYEKALRPFATFPILGERATSCLYEPWSGTAINNLKQFHPAPTRLRLVFVLRHPIRRLFSQYLYNRNFQEDLSLEEALAAWPRRQMDNWLPAYDYQGASRYGEALKKYRQAFGSKVGIFFMEDWQAAPEAFLADMLAFLGLPAHTFDPKDYALRNRSSIPPTAPGRRFLTSTWRRLLKPLLPDRTGKTISRTFKDRFYHRPALNLRLEKQLTASFLDDVAELEALTQRDLSHWKP